MKKLFGSFLALTCLILISCGGGNTPGAVVKKCMTNIDNGDYESAVKMMATPQGAFSEEEQTKMVGLLGMASEEVKEKEGIKTIDILEEEITGDDETATVTYKVEYNNGEVEEESTELVNFDGKWYMLIGLGM